MGASASRQERASHEFTNLSANGSPSSVPRLCRIQKTPGCVSYGFNLHAEMDLVGYIGKVDEGSPAEDAGLKRGDRILQVNGNCVSLDDIYEIADRIMEHADIVELLVVAPAPGEPLPRLVWAEDSELDIEKKNR